ncbi:MAG TPA: MFS transporter, partial [Xanthobacteraceae bacterium]|nr:MFS transporter [Xanthobacteraceae bacterium]
FITSAERIRAFGIFYTRTLGAGAIAPTVRGIDGDVIGLSGAVMVVAALTLATLPLAVALKRYTQEPSRG